jgi:chemotaxis signal transduction protein
MKRTNARYLRRISQRSGFLGFTVGELSLALSVEDVSGVHRATTIARLPPSTAPETLALRHALGVARIRNVDHLVVHVAAALSVASAGQYWVTVRGQRNEAAGSRPFDPLASTFPALRTSEVEPLRASRRRGVDLSLDGFAQSPSAKTAGARGACSTLSTLPIALLVDHVRGVFYDEGQVSAVDGRDAISWVRETLRDGERIVFVLDLAKLIVPLRGPHEDGIDSAEML